MKTHPYWESTRKHGEKRAKKDENDEKTRKTMELLVLLSGQVVLNEFEQIRAHLAQLRVKDLRVADQARYVASLVLIFITGLGVNVENVLFELGPAQQDASHACAAHGTTALPLTDRILTQREQHTFLQQSVSLPIVSCH